MVLQDVGPITNTGIDITEICLLIFLTFVLLQEMGRQKCYPYWPQEVGSEHTITFGQVRNLLICVDVQIKCCK